jgi:nitrogenase molybdenum-iron protein beta chain
LSTFIEQPRFSCALAAQQTVLAIPGALPIIHAGSGCSSTVFAFTALGAGGQGEGYGGGSAVACSNMSEQEVIFGGEERLSKLIASSLQVLKGDLFVVMAGCTAGIVGDDIESVSRSFAERGYPVVSVDTSGFRGSNYFGHETVLAAIIEQWSGDITPQPRPGLVNVFSVVPYQDPFWRGDL